MIHKVRDADFTVHARIRGQSIEQYVESRIREIKIQKKKMRKIYNFWASVVLALNLITMALSIVGISLINSQTSSDSKTTEVALTSVAAGFIILLFIIHFFNVIFRSISKERFYKEALDKIQHEVMRFNQATEYYNGKTNEDLVRNVENIVKETLAIKTVDSVPKVVIRALTGVEDA